MSERAEGLPQGWTQAQHTTASEVHEALSPLSDIRGLVAHVNPQGGLEIRIIAGAQINLDRLLSAAKVLREIQQKKNPGVEYRLSASRDATIEPRDHEPNAIVFTNEPPIQ